MLLSKLDAGLERHRKTYLMQERQPEITDLFLPAPRPTKKGAKTKEQRKKKMNRRI
jgi:hypothetical protein